jgi:hypothetical protein
MSTTLSNSLQIAGPIDQHGAVDLVNSPRQVTVLYQLGRDNSSASLKTSGAGTFWFNLTSLYHGTYRADIWNYSDSSWENATNLYTSGTGALSYSRAMSGVYNVSFVLVNVTAGGATAPTVSSVAASLIGQTTATINGDLTSLGSAGSVDVGFHWGTSPTLAGATNVTVGTMGGTGAFSKALSTLPSNTTHYFRAWALGDGFSQGSILSFATLPVPPSVSSAAATSVTASNATLNGDLTALGSWASVLEGFLYGTDPALAGATNVTVAQVASSGAYSKDLTLLADATPYYFRAWSLGGGFVQGSILTFTTNASSGGIEYGPPGGNTGPGDTPPQDCGLGGIGCWTVPDLSMSEATWVAAGAVVLVAFVALGYVAFRRGYI